MGGRDDLYLPGNREQLEELARSLAFGLNVASMDGEDTVSRELKLTTPNWIDFLTLGFHVLDRSLFQIYGENGRSFFMDELRREIYRHLTCEMPDSQAKEVGRNLIDRVNAAQEEYWSLFSVKGGVELSSPAPVVEGSRGGGAARAAPAVAAGGRFATR